MKVITALVALIALSVASIASAQYLVLHKCDVSGGASLIESEASSQVSSKLSSVQARIAAAVQATDAAAAADSIFDKLKAAKAPFTVKTLIPRHAYGRNGQPFVDDFPGSAARISKIWPSCKPGATPQSAWAAAWNPVAASFTDMLNSNLDQTYYFQSVLNIFPTAKAACDVAVQAGGSQVDSLTGAFIEPNGDCRVLLSFRENRLMYEPFVPYSKFQRFVKK